MKIRAWWMAATAAAALTVGSVAARPADNPGPLRPIRERAAALADLNIKRVDRLLLPAMRKSGVDCWITIARENNPDFVLDYIQDVPGAGGHRNAYVFFDDGSERVRRYVIGTHLPGHSRIFDKIIGYPPATGEDGPSLKPALAQLVAELKPKKIAINESRTIPMADGLTVEMKKFLVDAIGPEYAPRLVSAEPLIVDFLDTRLPEELEFFREATAATVMISAEVLSNKAVQPGTSTVADLRWYVLNRMAELDLDTWFPPGISIQRAGGEPSNDDTVVQAGDVIHTDIGVVYVGLSSDYQKNAYVLKPGEKDAPAGVQLALANSLKVQDAIVEVALPGRIGHVVKAEAEAAAAKRGVVPSVYSHSTGLGGHGVGAWMNPKWLDRCGMRTTFPLRLGAYYSIESNATTAIPEWDGAKLSMGTEEDSYMTEAGLKYLQPRQEKLYLIKGASGR